MGLVHGDRLGLGERLDSSHTVESPKARCLDKMA